MSKTPPKDHPTRTRIFRVTRMYCQPVVYEVWAADSDDEVCELDASHYANNRIEIKEILG